MTNIIVSGIITAVSIAVCMIYIKKEALKKEGIKAFLPKNTAQLLFGIAMILSVTIVFLVLNCLYKDNWLFSCKRIVFYTALWAIALYDYRHHIIRNKNLLFLLCIRASIFIAEIIFGFHTVLTELINCIIAGSLILIILCLMRLIVKDGIGFGDIKLFAVTGLYFGILGSFSVVFMSFIVSFVISLYLLIAKKKSKKDQIAFAPAVLLGTLLAVILFGA